MKKRLFAFLLITVLLLSSQLSAFAAVDPAVTIISPSQSITGDNLLISIKLTAPKTIKVYAFEEKYKVADKLLPINPLEVNIDNIDQNSLVSVALIRPEVYKSTGMLKFYNKKIENVSDGLYRIKVETLGDDGKVTYSTGFRVVVLAKTASGSEIFENTGGVLKWIQNLLKNIFGA